MCNKNQKTLGQITFVIHKLTETIINKNQQSKKPQKQPQQWTSDNNYRVVQINSIVSEI